MDVPSPSTLVSPPRRIQDVLQSENMSPQGRVPSASQMPNSPTRQSISSQLASPRYIKQFHALIEHQREVHSEERALWHTERAELQEKIAQLEASVRRYKGSYSLSPLSSPVGKNGTSGSSSFRNLLSSDGSRHTSASGTGDEVWRPKSDVQPTRTFSESSNPGSTTSESRLPSIAEDVTGRRKFCEDTPPDQGLTHKPSISGSEIDKNLDGINFKSTSLPPVVGKDIMTPQSPSVLSPSSPSRVSPATIELPPSSLTAPEDMYTRDAGHTPLARRTYFNTDGPASAPSSGTATPTQPERERPPLEPHTSSIKLPSERSNSYFPPPEDNPSDSDPELAKPLGLTNDMGEDKQFLNELDSKLLRAARSESYGSPAVAGAPDLAGPAKEEEKDFEQPEHEPKLRIKRSMNFGSAFGAKHCGRDV